LVQVLSVENHGENPNIQQGELSIKMLTAPAALLYAANMRTDQHVVVKFGA
jgi:hypothetical protein